MKKMAVMISLLVGILVLFSTVEPCLSQCTSMNAPYLRTDFSGCRYRTSQIAGFDTTDVKITACRYHVNNQEAAWTIVTNNPLVDGQWYNFDTEVRRQILEFTMPSGPNIPCDPSKDPPAGYKGVVMGSGMNSGPFMLTPSRAGGGVWLGTWKGIWNPDGSTVSTYEAEGQGGLIEGMVLYVRGTNPPGAGTNCKCCPEGTVIPANAYGPSQFNGCLSWGRLNTSR
jgi:hypothetical protein